MKLISDHIPMRMFNSQICMACHKLYHEHFIMTKKTNHGGARSGSGRPKKEPTKTVRVPVSKITAIKKLCTVDMERFYELEKQFGL